MIPDDLSAVLERKAYSAGLSRQAWVRPLVYHEVARTKALDVAVPTERRAAGMSDYDLSTMFPVVRIDGLGHG